MMQSPHEVAIWHNAKVHTDSHVVRVRGIRTIRQRSGGLLAGRPPALVPAAQLLKHGRC